MINEKISYRKARDLGDVFGTSFSFIKQHFKPFYASLLLFSAPFLLAGTLSYSYFAWAAGINSYNFSQNIGYSIGTFFVVFMIAMITMMIGLTVYTVALNKSLLVNETLETGESLTVRAVSGNFFKDFWRMLINIIVFSIVFILALAVCFLVMVAMYALLQAISYSSELPIIGTILMVLAFFLFLIPIISFVPVAAMFVCQRDRVNIFKALGKVFVYMKGNFWNTWVFSILALITYTIMGTIVQLPVLISTMVSTFTRLKSLGGQGVVEDPMSITLIILTIICALAGYMVMAVFYLMNIFHFTNLEEKKEGSKLIENINQIA